ncbi:MAG: GNAT family N-acetyltransferase [Defluviitaleaceae bacterium]|nr:GNAT family N-acetyltransferase [Defluviitaleaceae bacterium]
MKIFGGVIRKSTLDDLPKIMEIYAYAREFMRQSGNPNQWKDDHPSEETVKEDIENGDSYVCVDENDVKAVFFFSTKPDPTYTKIDGAWLNDNPYGVIHRIARAENSKGTGAFCINWCYNQIPNLRIDTHEDNTPMLNMLKTLGFERCGIIVIENGENRVAFQKKEKSNAGLN